MTTHVPPNEVVSATLQSLPLAASDQTIVLNDLARRIDAEHRQVATALQSALRHAIMAGELLLVAKGTVKHGQWLKWLAAHKFPQRTSTHYMELARRRDDLCDQNGNVLPISVNKALAMLRWPYYGGSGGDHEFENEYEPSRGWGCRAWGPFNGALYMAMGITECAPRPSLIARAYRAGKTPGLDAAGLRKVAALLIRYADAIEGAHPSAQPVRDKLDSAAAFE
jgi:hypothetical protein